MAGNGKVKSVLHMGIEQPGGFRFWVVIDAALGKNICDLLIDAPLAGTNGAHALQQFAEIVLAEVTAIFQPFIIHGKALDDVFLDQGRRPDTELRRLCRIDPVAH
ncbi:hypothetical protein D3C85_1364900 [compost metagenome]